MRNLEQDDEDSFKRQFGKYVQFGVNADAVSIDFYPYIFHHYSYNVRPNYCPYFDYVQCRRRTKLSGTVDN